MESLRLIYKPQGCGQDWRTYYVKTNFDDQHIIDALRLLHVPKYTNGLTMKITIMLMSLLVLSGCASNSMTNEQKVQLLKDYNERNTLTVTCPNGGCTIEYRDPRDKLQLPKNTNGYDVANSIVRSITNIATSVAPWAAVGIIATDGIKSAGDNYSNAYNNDSTTPVEPLIVDPVVVKPEIIGID